MHMYSTLHLLVKCDGMQARRLAWYTSTQGYTYIWMHQSSNVYYTQNHLCVPSTYHTTSGSVCLSVCPHSPHKQVFPTPSQVGVPHPITHTSEGPLLTAGWSGSNLTTSHSSSACLGREGSGAVLSMMPVRRAVGRLHHSVILRESEETTLGSSRIHANEENELILH